MAHRPVFRDPLLCEDAAWLHSIEQYGLFCKESISDALFMGYMAATWMFTLWHERYCLLDYAEKQGGAAKLIRED